MGEQWYLDMMARERRIALLIFLVLLCCYGYFFPRWAEWNQNSRMDLTLAIVEQGTIQIDDYFENTGDYAEYGGHIYTDKAPGTSFLGAPVYFAFKLLADTPPMRAALRRVGGSQALAATLKEGGTGLLEQKVYFAAALYATTFFTVAFPSALLGALLFLFMGRLLCSLLSRSALALAYGLGTIAFPYSTVFYGHQIATALLFFAFYLLFCIRQREMSNRWLWIVGGLMGLAVLIEFPALVPLITLSLYAFWFLERKWEIVRLVLGGVPFALILGWYNAAAFGSPFSSSYRYLGRFPQISNTGFLGFSWPSLEALWGVTFSPYRGLFVLSPFLLLVIPGFWHLVRSRKWRAEGLLWLIIILAQLALVSAWYDWFGGFAIGPRNLLNVLPFFMLPVAFYVQAWQKRPLQRGLVWGLVVVSFILVWIASVSGQEFAPYATTNPFPLVDFFWPKLRNGEITRNLGMVVGLSSWYSLLPLILVIGVALWIVWRQQPLAGFEAVSGIES
jgi:4-amino-4-deoxy-L-arabinose transferase-like glycosyltransferase